MLALFFIVQYHCRMSFFSLRYKLRTIPRSEIATQAHHNWHKLCQALTSHKAFNTTRQSTKEKPENRPITKEQFTGALHTLMQRTIEHEQITGAIRALKAKTVENEQITGTIRVIKQTAESERLHAALHMAKKRLEKIVFVEETPEDVSL